jgi:hypothetical protein
MSPNQKKPSNVTDLLRYLLMYTDYLPASSYFYAA